MKIAILYICTGKYKIFWKDFYLSCEKKFINEAEKEYFVFTDRPKIDFEKENKNIHRIFQENLGWPNNTLMRFDMFFRIKEKLINFDYIFFFNADLICLEKISASDFLPEKNENLVAVIHPGYLNKKKNKFPYDRSEKTLACISKNSGKYYFAGGLNGGRSKNFLEAISVMKNNIEIDKKNNIIAKWHDESHWNKYLETRTDIKILYPDYLYPEANNIPFKKIIMIRDKRKYLNYYEIGKEKINKTIFNKIKIYIEKVNFLKYNLFWHLFKKWINRFNLLRTIYREDKIKAIKNYIKNDFEYSKTKKEIDSFKTKSIYNFNGAKIPLSIITPDTFLNVLKPHIKNINYKKETVEKFYIEQKKEYKTLTYWKDNYLEREPDYIGGHLISHGFSYFFEEIVINNGDVVIDLGAAPGDFSAVCIINGASKVYAFEPEENNSSDIEKVNKLNGNKIDIIRKYCDSKTNTDTNCISLDDFVKTNNISKIDFIKADIEGAETKALIGAKNILKTHKPKLAFCTYHSIDDENNIEKLIIEINPDYKIYKQKGIIYAF